MSSEVSTHPQNTRRIAEWTMQAEPVDSLQCQHAEGRTGRFQVQGHPDILPQTHQTMNILTWATVASALNQQERHDHQSF
ncbi:mCG147624 [Mus musculus]|nr:mCG147624 [Mus musculus]